MGEEPEFSVDVVLKSDRARSFNGVRCVALSFPPATVTWILTSDEHPNGTNLLALDQFNLTDSGKNLTFTEDAIVEMRDLHFEDDGTFVCRVTNGLAEATRVFRLRVKCMIQYTTLTPYIDKCLAPAL